MITTVRVNGVWHICMLLVQLECLRDLQASAPPELQSALAELRCRAQQYDALSQDARRALVAEVVPLLLGPLQRCALPAQHT